MLRYMALLVGMFMFLAQAIVPSAMAKTEVKSRKKTELLQVDGRILFRFSQSQNEGKTIYGEPNDGFILRKVRFRFHGKLSDNIKYMIHVRADRGSTVELWDAFIIYKVKQIPIPTIIEAGMFKDPISMSYMKPGVKLWFPERPVAVNKIAPVWREVGVTLRIKPIKQFEIFASILNGEGWNSGKIYNIDGKYLYVAGVDIKPINNKFISWRFRGGYEWGHDNSPKEIYLGYGASNGVKRRLIDVETQLAFNQFGVILEGGYLYDNPKAVDNLVTLGKAKGYYAQADIAFPVYKKFHLVARYSWMDPNDKVNDKNDVDYTSVGFYYLINGWQAAIRADYVFAKERDDSAKKKNDLFCAEFQLLF